MELFYILKISPCTSICPQYCRRARIVDPAVNIISVENPAETRWRVDYPAGTLFRLASSPTLSAKRVVRTEVRWRWRQCRPAKTNRNRTNILRQWYFICLQRRIRTKTTMTFPFLSRRDSIPRRRNTIHRPREWNSNRKPKKHCFRSTDRFNRFCFHSSSNTTADFIPISFHTSTKIENGHRNFFGYSISHTVMPIDFWRAAFRVPFVFPCEHDGRKTVCKYGRSNLQIIIACFLGNKKNLKNKTSKSEINRSKRLREFNKTSKPNPSNPYYR